MLYDIRLEMLYDYDAPVHGGRHLVRVAPITIPGVQRVVASSLSFDPRPEQTTTFADFFGNVATTICYAAPHDALRIRLNARVNVENLPDPIDLSPALAVLHQQIAATWSLDPASPHHFMAGSPRIALDPAITAYAASAASGAPSVLAIVKALGQAIHRDFAYDTKATDVETDPVEAFALRRGVCQDFAHVMIAGLRGLGIPSGYVSGFLRTNPPAGQPRLEGADAMHAWVRAWCGQDMGWIGFDPTNAIMVGPDHICIGHGRDYADISPIVGVLKTHGSHEAKQSVDVLPVS